jgi:RNA polymerase sigma factor (sigma-70 family)
MHESLPVDELVGRARAGDQASWNALVDRFLPLVNSVIAKFRLSWADADDVNQTVWLRLVEHLGDLREPRALPGWLATTTRHESLRIIRLRGRDTPVDPQSYTMERVGEQPELDEDLIREERAQALRAALLELPAGRRELLELLMTDPPVSYDEISAKLGIPKGSIGPTRARALEQLRNTRAMRALVAAPAVVE